MNLLSLIVGSEGCTGFTLWTVLDEYGCYDLLHRCRSGVLVPWLVLDLLVD